VRSAAIRPDPIRLPAQAAPDDDALTIVLAEDDPADALLTVELISESGLAAKVTRVATAAEASRLVRAGGVDCLVLDLHLPDLSGIGALEALLPTVPSTAVVVMTGLDDRAAGLAAMRSGAQDYLVKGQVEAEWLGRAIRYAVQRKRTEQAASDLRAARWRAAENARLERGLLPTPLLRGSRVRVTSRYLPHRAGALLGGDYFDVVETADGVIHAVIGDVSGHGPDEAALGAALRVAWRTLVLSGRRGPGLLRNLEQVLVAERGGDETYTTVATLEWRPDERVAHVIRAGHPAVLTRSGGAAVLREGAHGPALGLLPGCSDWPVTSVPMGPHDEIVLYTDGLYENRDDFDGSFGIDRLVRSANRLSHLSDGAFLDALIAATRNRGGRGDRDDVAVLHLRRLEPGRGLAP
jgi:serine phosphatase RsbU (regulator of sigma subunit)